MDLHGRAKMVAQCSSSAKAIHVRGGGVNDVDFPSGDVLHGKREIAIGGTYVGYRKPLREPPRSRWAPDNIASRCTTFPRMS